LIYFLQFSKNKNFILLHIKNIFPIKNQSVTNKVASVIKIIFNSLKSSGRKKFLIIIIQAIMRKILISIFFTTFSCSLSQIIVLSFLKIRLSKIQGIKNKI